MSALVALIVLLPAQVPGSISIDPHLSWYTVESEHFDVHFSSRGRPDSASVGLAREVAGIAEGVFSAMTPVVGWTPRGRTQVIIADFYDYANAWATPFPDNVITIIPTPPAGSKSNEGDWLRTLILHEYAHILQTDQVSGIPAALRKVFGRISIPNALAPAWLNEGYGIYSETRFTPFGRLRSAEYSMIGRAAADSGKLLPVDRCSGYELQRYPGGDAPYLCGSWLHGSVVARSDSGIWDRYSRSRAAGLPFFENLHARRVLGRSIYSAWVETRDDLTAAARQTARTVGQEPMTHLRQVTHRGFSTSSPLWSRYPGRFYYIARTGREYPSIEMVDTLTGQRTVLYRGLVTGDLTLSPDGRQLAFAQLDLVGGYYEHTEVFALDLVSGRVRQLTRGQRARDADFAPDTSLLVFVSNGSGQNDLKLLDLKTGKVSRLTETEDHTGFHGPRFSPSGKWIAVGVSHPGGYADIELVDRQTGWTIPVTHDRATDLSPAWSRTGKLLYFVSDRTGVFNLYAYQLATGKTYAVTNVQYGVFEPAISFDNRRIAVTSYSVSGYDVSVTDVRAGDWRPAPEFVDTLPRSTSLLTSPDDRRISKDVYYYNPISTLRPAFWLPWLSLSATRLSELGAFTIGWDALQFHQYQLAGGYRFAGSSPFLSAAYTLRRYRPVVSALADLDLRRQEGSVNVEFPFPATRHSSWLDLGITAARDMTESSHDSDRVPSELIANLDWSYSDAHQYRFGVAPVEGRVLGLHSDLQSTSVIGDRDMTRALAYWYQYLGNPPQTRSLRSKLALGTAFGRCAGDAFTINTQPGLLGVRGYSEESEAARTVVAAGLQFRAPLWWIERGIGTGPLFLQNVNAAGFVDAGTTFDNLPVSDSMLVSRARIGVGAELRVDLIVAHVLPVSIYGGCGFGLDPLWSYRPYFGIASSVLAGILSSRDPVRRSWSPLLPAHPPEPH